MLAFNSLPPALSASSTVVFRSTSGTGIYSSLWPKCRSSFSSPELLPAFQPSDAGSRTAARFSIQTRTSRCGPFPERFSHGSASACKCSVSVGAAAPLSSRTSS